DRRHNVSDRVDAVAPVPHPHVVSGRPARLRHEDAVPLAPARALPLGRGEHSGRARTDVRCPRWTDEEPPSPEQDRGQAEHQDPPGPHPGGVLGALPRLRAHVASAWLRRAGRGTTMPNKVGPTTASWPIANTLPANVQTPGPSFPTTRSIPES